VIDNYTALFFFCFQTLLPVILGHGPAGSSTKTFIHYAQEIKSGKCAGREHLHALGMTVKTPPLPQITYTILPHSSLKGKVFHK